MLDKVLRAFFVPTYCSTPVGVSKLYNLVSLLVATGTGVIIYGVLCYVFGIEEVRVIVGKIKDRTMRKMGMF